MTADDNVSATGQQHTQQPEFINEGEVDQNAEQCHDTCPLPATLTDNQTTEFSNQSLESKNIRLKKTVAQFQKDFLRMEAHCVNLELKYQNQALKEGQHDIDVIETINIELEHKVAKLLKENETLKEICKENDSSKNMPRFSSNDMVHNHYLDEARKKTQEKGENSEPSVMPSAKSQSTANDSKPKPGSITKTLGIDMHLRVVA
ncbi:hypothetical protein Tco_1477064 [Tanacetum coccineum]